MWRRACEQHAGGVKTEAQQGCDEGDEEENTHTQSHLLFVCVLSIAVFVVLQISAGGAALPSLLFLQDTCQVTQQ